MTRTEAHGGNYRIEIGNGVATCHVWQRPDVDSQTGSRWAAEKVTVIERLATEPAARVGAFVLDLRRAPPVVGPKTEEALGRMLVPWERARRKVIVVAGSSATQALQIGRVVRHCAPTQGHVARTDDEVDRLLEINSPTER